MIDKLKALLVKLDGYGHGSGIVTTAQSSSDAKDASKQTTYPDTAVESNEPLDLTLSTKVTTLVLSIAVIVYLAFFNPLGVTPDYAPYIAAFDWARQASWSQVFPNPNAWEPGFMVLTFALSKVISANGLVFLAIVLLASSVKLGLLYKIASPIAFALAMVLFFFKYFPLQDYNQLRGAIAISFLMLVYYQWTWKDNLILALLFSVCAVSFHYLVLALLPFVFLVKPVTFLQRSRALILPLAILGFLVIAGYVVLEYLVPLIPRLATQSYEGIATNSYLSPVFYPAIFLIAMSLLLWNECTDNMKRAIILQLIGFAIFYGFFNFDVIAIRLREAFSIFLLFYLADYSRTTPRLRLTTIVFILMNIALGSYLFYFSNYLR